MLANHKFDPFISIRSFRSIHFDPFISIHLYGLTITDSMTQTLNEIKASPKRLRLLVQKGYLSPPAFERGMKLIGHTPQRADWTRFINLLLLGLGALLLICGIFFFLAYNWADLSRFARFATVEVAILVSVGLATWAGIDRITGKIALTFASLLVGALLVVFGQEYQTGADSWELFWNWALLITGFALVARFDLLWAIWLGLLNLTLFFYWDQVQAGSNWYVGWELLFGLNAVALLVWEALSRWRRWSWVQSHWLSRLIALIAFGCILIPTVALILDWNELVNRTPTEWLALVLYAAFLLIIVIVYLRICPDLFMLTAAALSVIIVLTALSGRWLVEADEVFGTLATGVLVIIQAALAAYGLRMVQKQMEAAE